MRVPDGLLSACATCHGQAQLFLQVPALRPPGGVLGRVRVIARLWDGTPRYSLLDGGVGGVSFPVPPPVLCTTPALTWGCLAHVG